MNPTLPVLMTPQEVAEWLTLPTARVVRLARKGEIPCIVLPGNDVMFDREALATWLQTLRAGKEANYAS